MTKWLTIGFLASIIVGAAFWLPADEKDDVNAIRKVQERQATAWNQHDGGAYADLFTEDGEVINVVGWWWKGRSEIKSKLTAGFAFVFKESTLKITEVQVKFLTPDIALAHVRWTMTGARTPPNIPEPRQGIQIQILKKESGQWKILSFQNTNSIPETPFPSGPPTSSNSSN